MFCDGRVEAGDCCDDVRADEQGSHCPDGPAVAI